MNVIPFVHEGLGNSSYLVDLGNGAAAVVDPDRSTKRYVEAAGARSLRIDAVFETHLHADFVTGALELARATGARIFASAGSALRYSHHGLKPGDQVPLGGARMEAVASSGHTPEHLSYVLQVASRPPVLFSGGALIVGGAARTDLISSQDTESLTRDLYRTLHEAFASLPDETSLYPTHGGGSFCSTGSGAQRSSTLGQERQANPLLRLDDEDEFVSWFPTTFPAAPDYFFRLRAFNQKGPRLRSEIKSPEPLLPEKFDLLRSKALVLDVRSIEEYSVEHIPGSLNIPFRSEYATWLGWLVAEGAPLLFVLGDADLDAVMDESLLVGYEDFAGYLDGDMKAWKNAGFEIARTQLVGAEAAHEAIREGAIALDIRESSEFAAGHIDEAVHIPLGELSNRLSDLPQGRPILAYCGHGERASSAASILERAGHSRLLNLAGGLPAWRIDMTKEFDSDLQELRGELSASRAELVSVIESLGDSDLDRARRGGWTIARVLEHVIQSEAMYTAAIAAIVGGAASSPPAGGPPASQAEAVRQLLSTREALATALTSATEENFYQLQRFGHDEYSVASVLENVANHDREHAEQIRRTLATKSIRND